jgi:hypothetical protein
VTRLLYVTGVSCAGKSTLGEALYERPDVHAHYDLDADATERPRTAWLDWLRWQAAEYLVEADERSGPDTDSSLLIVVTGIVWPFRVIESPAWASALRNEHLEVGWVMLDPPWKVLRERLAERTAHKPKRERRELLAYNKGLRAGLRQQVLAVHGGWTLRSGGEPADLAEQVMELHDKMVCR